MEVIKPKSGFSTSRTQSVSRIPKMRSSSQPRINKTYSASSKNNNNNPSSTPELQKTSKSENSSTSNSRSTSRSRRITKLTYNPKHSQSQPSELHRPTNLPIRRSKIPSPTKIPQPKMNKTVGF